MKLNSASVNEALNQFSAQPIPANHPVVPRLANMFGDHTFFLDAEGLLIIEQAGHQIRGARGIARADGRNSRPRQACSRRLRVRLTDVSEWRLTRCEFASAMSSMAGTSSKQLPPTP